MKTFKCFCEEQNKHEWAFVGKKGPVYHDTTTGETKRVMYQKHHSDTSAPHSPGRSAVWFVKKNNKWHPHGNHGNYDYSDLLKK